MHSLDSNTPLGSSCCTSLCMPLRAVSSARSLLFVAFLFFLDCSLRGAVRSHYQSLDVVDTCLRSPLAAFHFDSSVKLLLERPLEVRAGSASPPKYCHLTVRTTSLFPSLLCSHSPPPLPVPPSWHSEQSCRRNTAYEADARTRDRDSFSFR